MPYQDTVSNHRLPAVTGITGTDVLRGHDLLRVIFEMCIGLSVVMNYDLPMWTWEL